MVTLVMLLLLVSYYFVALKYSQEAFLEFASVNAVDVEQESNTIMLEKLLSTEKITHDSPDKVIAILSQQYPAAFHLLIKGERLLVHNLPSTVTNIVINKNGQLIDVIIQESNNRYNLSINEKDRIVLTYYEWQIISLPNSVFNVTAPSSISAFNIEQKFFIALMVLAILAIAITWLITKKFLTPIENLTQGFEQLAKGKSKVKVKVVRQDELGLLAKRFNETVAELEKLEQIRKDMITDIAHELRTPLSNIQVKIEAIIDGVIDVDEKTFPSILTHINGLAHLINDLQALSLAEAGQLNFQLKDIPIQNVIQSNFELFKLAMDNKNIEFQLSYSEPANIHVDEHRLNQILFNIIENARKYTPENGKVDFFGQLKDEYYYIGVADSGTGLSEQERSKVFERLYRAQPDNMQFISGHGLGLSIAQKLTTLMGGTITVKESNYGGLLIIIQFPIISRNFIK
jgi:signal transduction histidine kinase